MSFNIYVTYMLDTILFVEIFNTLFVFYTSVVTDLTANIPSDVVEPLFEFVTDVLYTSVELFKNGTELIIDILSGE